MVKRAVIFTLLLLISGGCAMLDDSAQQSDYEETKQMVVDVLQTEDGKKAIQEVLKEEEMKEELVMEQDFIKETIQTTLAGEKAQEYWQKVMKDPKFAETFAQNISDENEKLLKGLMKDPEYQSMMLDVMKDPEMEENYIGLMKTKDYRQQIMAIVTEAMESPLFVARVSEILQDVAKDELESGKKEGEESGGQDGGNTGEEEGSMGGSG